MEVIVIVKKILELKIRENYKYFNRVIKCKENKKWKIMKETKMMLI